MKTIIFEMTVGENLGRTEETTSNAVLFRFSSNLLEDTDARFS